MRRMCGATTLAVVTAMAIVTGCGGATRPVQQLRSGTDPKHPSPRPVVVGRVDDLAGLDAKVDAHARLVAPIRVRRGETVLTPAPTTTLPTLTADQAIDVLRAEKLYEGTLASTPPTVAFGLMSSRTGGGGVPAVPETPVFSERPTWAIMFHDVRSEYGASGPANRRSPIASPEVRQPVQVNFLAYVDAVTGKFLFADEIGLLQDVSEGS